MEYHELSEYLSWTSFLSCIDNPLNMNFFRIDKNTPSSYQVAETSHSYQFLQLTCAPKFHLERFWTDLGQIWSEFFHICQGKKPCVKICTILVFFVADFQVPLTIQKLFAMMGVMNMIVFPIRITLLGSK